MREGGATLEGLVIPNEVRYLQLARKMQIPRVARDDNSIEGITCVLLPGCTSLPSNFFEHGAAALADGGIVFVFAHVDGVVPAAVAFLAFGFFDFYVYAGCSVTRARYQSDGRDDEKVAQFGLVPFKKGMQRIGGGDQDLRF